MKTVMFKIMIQITAQQLQEEVKEQLFDQNSVSQ